MSQKWQSIYLKIVAVTFGSSLGIIFLGTGLNIFFGPVVLPIPSANSIGRDYLNAVIQKDRHYSKNACVQSALDRDIDQYSDIQEVRNISVKSTWKSGNGDHFFETTDIMFEYRHPKEPKWQKGQIFIMTASNLLRGDALADVLPFRRIICAGG
jgi:hypothetical protein